MSLYETHLKFVDTMRIAISNPDRNEFEQSLVDNYKKLVQECYGDSDIAFAKLYTYAEKNSGSSLMEKKGDIRKGVMAAAVLSALAFGGIKVKDHAEKTIKAEKEMHQVIDNYPGETTFYAECQNIVSMVNLSDSVDQISEVFSGEFKRLDAETGGYISKGSNLDKLLYVLTSVLYWHFEYQQPSKAHEIIEQTKKKFKK